MSDYVCYHLEFHAAALLITSVRRYDHIALTLRDTLHWLPVAQRIEYKVVLMALDCVQALVLPTSGTFVNQCRLAPVVRTCDLQIAAISYRERWGSATDLAVFVLLLPPSGPTYLHTFTPEMSDADNSRED
jgi:hypothetical protein